MLFDICDLAVFYQSWAGRRLVNRLETDIRAILPDFIPCAHESTIGIGYVAPYWSLFGYQHRQDMMIISALQGSLQQDSIKNITDNSLYGLLSDMDKLPITDNSIDFLPCIHTLEALPSEQVGYFLSEVERVLKLSGRMVVILPGYNFWPFSSSMPSPFHYGHHYSLRYWLRMLAEYHLLPASKIISRTLHLPYTAKGKIGCAGRIHMFVVEKQPVGTTYCSVRSSIPSAFYRWRPGSIRG